MRDTLSRSTTNIEAQEIQPDCSLGRATTQHILNALTTTQGTLQQLALNNGCILQE